LAKGKANKTKGTKKPSNKSLVAPGGKAVSSASLETERRAVLGKAKKFVRPLVPSKKRFLMVTLAIVAGVIGVALIVFAILIYQFNSSNNVVYRVSRFVPFPAARVDGRFVSYGDYLFQLNPLKHYYENSAVSQGSNAKPVDFSSPEGKKKLEQLQQLALREAEETAVIKQLAKEQGVSVSKQDLDGAVNEAIEREGGQNKFNQAIEYFYGWDVNDFRKVMKIQLLQRKLQPTYSGDERAKAEAALKRVKGGEDFAKVATEVSQDPGSKDKGGDLGFTAKGSYVPEFEAAAYNLKPGEVSGIVETQFGFHIIKLTEKKDDQIKVSHILVPYKDIQQIISQQIEKSKKTVFIKVKPADPNSTAESQSNTPSQ
jgi:parvulin-like peptidyl-prolyl isomerase